MAFPTALIVTTVSLLVMVTSVQSQSCKSQIKLGNNKAYALCETLPALKSELHYTYNATNGSLSIAFVATPSKPGGWISWSINPTGTGMVGAQAFVAYEFNKSVQTTTLNISGYRVLTPGKLAFNFWDVSAEKKNDVMTLYASLAVPGNKTVVNQVWQVGPGVDANGVILPHPFAGESLMSKSVLSLNGALAPSPSPAPSPSTSGSGGGGPSTGVAPAPAGNGTSGSLGRMMKVSRFGGGGGFESILTSGLFMAGLGLFFF